MGESLIFSQLLSLTLEEDGVDRKIREAIEKLESLRVEELSETQKMFLTARIKSFLSVFDNLGK